MKVKRQKKAQRILTFYRSNFGLSRTPYSILVDGTFCQAALESRINLREQLPGYLGAPVEIFTTQCVIRELKHLGGKVGGALFIASQFEAIKCKCDRRVNKKVKKESDSRVPSERPVLIASNCLVRLAKTQCSRTIEDRENHRFYFMATQDPNVTAYVRALPGCPLLYIKYNALIIEPPSQVTKAGASKSVQSRIDSSGYQTEVLSVLKVKNDLVPTETLKRKRKGPKGKNPLSCKKSKKTKQVDSATVTSSIIGRSRKSRSRHRKKQDGSI